MFLLFQFVAGPAHCNKFCKHVETHVALVNLPTPVGDPLSAALRCCRRCQDPAILSPRVCIEDKRIPLSAHKFISSPSRFSALAIMAAQISKKKKFVADGVLYAELNELLTRELAEEGYSGVEVRVTPSKTEVVIRATRTQSVLGEKGRRIRELTAVVQKRFAFPENSVELFVEKVANRGLCAIAQAESLRYKLVGGLAVRRACYGVLRFVMENGAKVCS